MERIREKDNNSVSNLEQDDVPGDYQSPCHIRPDQGDKSLPIHQSQLQPDAGSGAWGRGLCALENIVTNEHTDQH